jgi:YggT family protein
MALIPVTAVGWLLEALYVFLLVRILFSWIPGSSVDHPVVQFVHRVTAPILDPIRRIVPPVAGLDFSPLIACLLLSLAHRVLIDFMFRLAYY